MSSHSIVAAIEVFVADLCRAQPNFLSQRDCILDVTCASTLTCCTSLVVSSHESLKRNCPTSQRDSFISLAQWATRRRSCFQESWTLPSVILRLRQPTQGELHSLNVEHLPVNRNQSVSDAFCSLIVNHNHHEHAFRSQQTYSCPTTAIRIVPECPFTRAFLYLHQTPEGHLWWMWGFLSLGESNWPSFSFSSRVQAHLSQVSDSESSFSFFHH